MSLQVGEDALRDHPCAHCGARAFLEFRTHRPELVTSAMTMRVVPAKLEYRVICSKGSCGMATPYRRSKASVIKRWIKRV